MATIRKIDTYYAGEASVLPLLRTKSEPWPKDVYFVACSQSLAVVLTAASRLVRPPTVSPPYNISIIFRLHRPANTVVFGWSWNNGGSSASTTFNHSSGRAIFNHIPPSINSDPGYIYASGEVVDTTPVVPRTITLHIPARPDPSVPTVKTRVQIVAGEATALYNAAHLLETDPSFVLAACVVKGSVLA